MHASLGATFIYVTHDQAEAMTMADRIVVMHLGRVQQVGPPLAVYGDPANRFVAGFFGVPAMNFIDGELRGEEGGLIFESPAVRLELKGGDPLPSRPVTLGVRPEHVRLTAEANGGRATVSLLEPLGDATLAFLDYGGAGSLVAKVDVENRLAVGDRRGFTFRRDRIVFFDTATGERILRS